MLINNNIPELNANIIKKLINKAEYRHGKMIALYERYKASEDGVPILTRRYRIDGIEQADKINNKINNNFFGEIVDMKVGFFCGVPISYTLDKEAYTELVEKGVVGGMVDKIKSAVGIEPKPQEEEVVSPQYDAGLETIERFNTLNAIDDLDSETAKMATICGYCGRLMYWDRTQAPAEMRAMLVDPWEIIFIGDSIEAPDMTIRYYDSTEYDKDGEETLINHADVYTATDIIEYAKKKDEDKYKLIGSTPHLVGYNPLIGFANNEEMLGDAEPVLNEIDGYDRTVSDVDSELEQLRLAYLSITGATITEAVLKDVKRTGAFSLPDKDSKIEFITKDINDAVVEHHLDRLERNIYRFSRTPNLNDETFSGDISGVALKYKFRSFEDKCKTAELKFKKALMQQYKILCDAWAMQGVAIDYLDVDFTFTRNYPQNLIEEIDFLHKAKGIVSEATAFSLVSFINNPEKEIAALESQQMAELDQFVMRNEAMAATSHKEQNAEDGEE